MLIVSLLIEESAKLSRASSDSYTSYSWYVLHRHCHALAILTSLRLAKRFSEASTFSIRNLAGTGARESTDSNVARRSDVTTYDASIAPTVPVTPKPVHIRLANHAKFIWKAVKESRPDGLEHVWSVAGEQ